MLTLRDINPLRRAIIYTLVTRPLGLAFRRCNHPQGRDLTLEKKV